MTHAWAIIAVMGLGLALGHLGIFDATAAPRVTGFNPTAVRPIPGQVQMYSDGMLVTVINTRAHKVYLDWITVAPYADKSDVIMTQINDDLSPGELGIYFINSSNIQPTAPASLDLIKLAESATYTVDLYMAFQQRWTIARQDYILISGGTLRNIPYTTEPSGETIEGKDCTKHRECDCTENSDCPIPDCQVCVGGKCDNEAGCPAGETCSVVLSIPDGLFLFDGACAPFVILD